MSTVITGSNGHIGAALATSLLDAGEKITVIARDPEKVAAFGKRGARVEVGSLADRDFVVAATRGASALFWLTPPNMSAPDFRGYQKQLAAVAAAAIKVNAIPRVVNLSSVGAQHDRGVGPVNGLHDVEQAINAAATNVTHLRPGYFMENFFGSLDTIRGASSVFMPVAGSVRGPMVATRDIAKAAAAVLRDPSWKGQRVLTLYGPAELSYDELAATLSRVLGRTIAHVQVTPEQALAALTGMGISASMAAGFVELYAAVASGHLTAGLPAQPSLRGTTSFEHFVREVLAPALG